MTTTLIDIFAASDEEFEDSFKSMSSPVPGSIDIKSTDDRVIRQASVTCHTIELLLLSLSDIDLDTHGFWKASTLQCPDALLNIRMISEHAATLLDTANDIILGSIDAAPQAKEKCRPIFSEIRCCLYEPFSSIASAITEAHVLLSRSIAALEQKREIQAYTIHRYNILEEQKRLRSCISQCRLFFLFRAKPKMLEQLRPPRTWLESLGLAPIHLSSWSTFETYLPQLLDRMVGTLNDIEQEFVKLVNTILAVEEYAIRCERSGMDKVANRQRYSQGTAFLQKSLSELSEQFAGHQKSIQLSIHHIPSRSDNSNRC